MAGMAALLGFPAVAVCDRMGLYGMARFTQKAFELEQCQPLVGCELAMEDGTVLPVLVRNRDGYHHLCSLLTRAHLRAAKGEAAIAWEELPEFAEGLIALTGDGEGPLRQALMHGEHRRPACRLGRPRPSPRATDPVERVIRR
jgi:error-prone DNA polymerase